MGQNNTVNLRAVALVGHGAAGKTTLVESLLAASGVITSRGSVEKGNTVCDFDPQEKELGHSLNSAMASLNWPCLLLKNRSVTVAFPCPQRPTINTSNCGWPLNVALIAPTAASSTWVQNFGSTVRYSVVVVTSVAHVTTKRRMLLTV